MTGISVIVVAYNRRAMLAEALRSCELQHRSRPIEIVVIDNGSAEDLSDVTNGASSCRLIRSTRGTIAAARNLGVAHSSHGLIAFLDSDDLILPSKLSRQAEVIEETSAGVALTNYFTLKNGRLGSPPNLSEPKNFWRSGFPFGATAMMFTRDTFETIGGFDESLVVCEDWDIYVRCMLSAVPSAFCEDPLYVYRLHSENISADPTIDHQASWQALRQRHGIGHDRPLLGYRQVSRRRSKLIDRSYVWQAVETLRRVRGSRFERTFAHSADMRGAERQEKTFSIAGTRPQ